MGGVEELGFIYMDKVCNLILAENRVQELIKLVSGKVDNSFHTFLVDFNSKINNDLLIELFASVNGFEFLSHYGTLEELKIKLNLIGYTKFNILRN